MAKKERSMKKDIFFFFGLFLKVLDMSSVSF